MKCDNCKHADWKRTINGRLHPDKSGRCAFTKTVQTPPSMSTWGRNIDNDGAIKISGGYIERGEELRRVCAYYEASK